MTKTDPCEKAKALTPDELRGWAREDEGQCRHPATYRRGVGHYDWHYDPALPIDRIRNTHTGYNPGEGEGVTFHGPDEARDWMADEARMQDDDGRNGTDYYCDMAEWWKTTPNEPITVSLEDDGFYYVWGGYHRHALSVIYGHTTIPAVVGVLRKD